MLSEAGKTDQRLIALIDEALEAIGAEPGAARAALLSAKSQELYRQDAQGQVGAGGRGGDRDRPPGGRAPRWPRRCTEIFLPARARAPLASGSRSPTRCWSSGRTCGDPESVMRGHAYRLQNSSSSGTSPASTASWRSTRHGRRAADADPHLADPALRGMRAAARRGPRGRRALRRGSPGATASGPSSHSRSSTTGSSWCRSAASRAGPASCCRGCASWSSGSPAIPAWRSALISLAARAGRDRVGGRAGALRRR